MNKVIAIGATLLLGITLTACGSKLTAESQNSHNGFTIPVKGTSNQSSVYWKTDADGTNKVKVKDGKFNFTVPSKAHKFTIGISNSKNMDDVKTIDIKGEKPIADYSEFLSTYNAIDEDSTNVMPNSPKSDTNYARYKNDSALLLNVDDGEMLGINIYCQGHEKWFSSMVGLVSGSLSGDSDTIIGGLKTAVDKPDQYITKQSGKIKYTFKINKSKSTYQLFVHS